MHEFLLVENYDNRSYESIATLYNDALHRASHDLVFFVHQDVYFPDDWEAQAMGALRDLEKRDPSWGVIGAVGMSFDTQLRESGAEEVIVTQPEYVFRAESEAYQQLRHILRKS
jgi:hypothetical protein